MTNPPTPQVVCLYMGRSDECVECGGGNETGTQFCSHDCADHFAERGREQQQALARRRAADDAFAAAAARLRAEDPQLTDQQIDEQLRWMP